MYRYGNFSAFFLWSPLGNYEKKSCLNKLKFGEASRNQKRSICWKFKLSISLGTQKSAKTPPAVGKMIRPFWLWREFNDRKRKSGEFSETYLEKFGETHMNLFLPGFFLFGTTAQSAIGAESVLIATLLWQRCGEPDKNKIKAQFLASDVAGNRRLSMSSTSHRHCTMSRVNSKIDLIPTQRAQRYVLSLLTFKLHIYIFKSLFKI